jgi:hypothetical protein
VNVKWLNEFNYSALDPVLRRQKVKRRRQPRFAGMTRQDQFIAWIIAGWFENSAASWSSSETQSSFCAITI